ncbi:MAG: FG-GAP-like repeat-containing protein, partial [Desulfobacteraceae bacterium]
MLESIRPAERPVFRFITWCTMYIFFFQVLSYSALSYATAGIPAPAGSSSQRSSIQRSFLDMVTDFFVSPAQAATDDIRATIGASDDTGAPADSSDNKYPAASSGSSGSIDVGGGSGSVNSVMGSYGYSYPIQVPPGRGGLSPELAITYSSMAGNGWLGLGWDLSIGSIQRSVKDGKPDYDDDDTFVINLKGSAITLVREDDEFRLKDEGLFLRILKQGDGWVATDKGGTEYHFGTTQASRQYAPEGIFKWCLDLIRDANGNEILFSYDTDTDNNQIYLQQISYDVDNYILFEFEPADRDDAPSFYATFFNVRTVRRLQTIQVFNGGLDTANLVRRYQLNYEPAETTNQSMLKSITQYGSEGTALPAVILDYTASQSYENQPFSEAAADSYPSRSENIATGDFTGDGRADILVTPGPGSSGSGWKLYEAVDGGFSLTAEGTEFNSQTKITPGDFNGDGKTDVMAAPCTISYQPSEIYLSNGQGFEPPLVGPSVNAYTSINILDLKGNGKSDLLLEFHTEKRGGTGIGTFYYYDRRWALFLNSGNGFQQIRAGGDMPMSFAGLSGQLIIGDFNGDGKSDFIDIKSFVSSELYLSTGNDIIKASDTNPAFSLPEDLNRAYWRTGDFNGDGTTDILAVDIVANTFDSYRLYISTGNALVKVKEGTWPGRGKVIMPADYNGDGRTDLLIKSDPSKGTTWDGYHLLLSTGQDFVEAVNEQWPSWTERFHPGDYNGDGRTDLLVTADKQYDSWTGYQLLHARIDQSALIPQTMPRLLGSITNILGATTEITYEPSSIWPKDIDGDNTHRSMPSVLPTVSALTIDDNMAEGGHIATSTYAYEGGLFDLGEREFRGFGKVTVEDQVTHIAAVNYYNQEPRFQGRVKKSITRTPNGVPVVQTVNNWEAFVYSSAEETERTFAFVRSNTTTSYDDAGDPLATISTSYDYDNYGNMIVEDKSELNHRTGDTTTRFVRTQYRNDTVNWILGQPENIRTDTMDPGPPEPGNIGAAALRETRMEYDPDRPWLLQHSKQVHWEDQDGVMVEQEITTTYDYDEFGNPTRVSNPRNPSWGTLTDYSESNGMFPNRTTNALGHTIHRVFDPRFGAVTQETLNPADGDQQKTTTLYDEFGRPELVTYPDLTTKALAYHIEPGNHFIRVTSTLMPTVTTYYDNRDRVIREEADDGIRAIVTETIYNDAGQIWKKSLPHFWDAAPEYSVNAYEPLRRRIQRQTHPDNTYRTIVYDGFNETITDEKGQEKIITKDSLGRLKKVVEPTGGVTEYDYDLFGNLIWIIDPMGNQTHIAYDDLGRKISMDDPYMGQWAYKYDAAGNLVRQKDGRDRIVEMTYDQLNRLVTKTYQDTGRIIEYTYDEVRAGFFNKGGLTTLTATEPGSLFNTIAYNYDRMGRNVSETRTIDGTAYTTRRQYDAAGRPDIITYPDGSTRIDYDYHAMGHLEKVYKVETDQSRTLLAEYSNHNALGQVGSLTYGNGAVTSYDYWPGHHRLRSMQTTAQATPGSWGTIQDLEYHFDNLGNVETITDHLHGVGFDFDYDSVSRLTHARATCAGDADREYDQAYTYDLAGNMAAKTGKGGFHVLEWEDAQKHIRPAAVAFEQNVTGVGQRDIFYNQENKPTEITYNGQTAYLSYDGEGQRIKKTGGGQSTIYVGGLYEISSGQAVAHIFAGGKRIASIKAGQQFYTHGDHLGSTSVVTNGNGLPVEEIGYLPFGATLFRKAYNNGTWTSVYRFTGQEYDAEYALYNYNARLYDPVMGRFITADTVVPDWTDPQSLNRYAYCRNNPLIYVDPSG